MLWPLRRATCETESASSYGLTQLQGPARAFDNTGQCNGNHMGARRQQQQRAKPSFSAPSHSTAALPLSIPFSAPSPASPISLAGANARTTPRSYPLPSHRRTVLEPGGPRFLNTTILAPFVERAPGEGDVACDSGLQSQRRPRSRHASRRRLPSDGAETALRSLGRKAPSALADAPPPAPAAAPAAPPPVPSSRRRSQSP